MNGVVQCTKPPTASQVTRVPIDERPTLAFWIMRYARASTALTSTRPATRPPIIRLPAAVMTTSFHPRSDPAEQIGKVEPRVAASDVRQTLSIGEQRLAHALAGRAAAIDVEHALR